MFSWFYNTTSQLLNKGVNANEDEIKIVVRIIKIAKNLINASEEKIEYILSQGLIGLLLYVIDWNCIGSTLYKTELDLYCCDIITNLCKSKAFGYGNDLISNGLQLILDRFIAMIDSTTPELEKSATDLVMDLVYYQKDAYKV